jgi:hypothetical protein
MVRAQKCATLDELIAFARDRNDENATPLPDWEVIKAAGSAWDKTENGTNWFIKGAESVVVPNSIIDEIAWSDPYALALLSLLRRYHGNRESFVLANATASKHGWADERFKKARKRLESAGLIECIHRGGLGPGDPPLYKWK